MKAQASGARMGSVVPRPDERRGPPRACAPYWVIARRERGRIEAFTVRLGGGEALPIFSLQREARSFLRSYEASGWEIREMGAGELVSLLSGLCGRVGRVVLDPPPDEADEALLGLLSVGRKVFVESLLGRGRAWFEGWRLDERAERARR